MLTTTNFQYAARGLYWRPPLDIDTGSDANIVKAIVGSDYWMKRLEMPSTHGTLEYNGYIYYTHWGRQYNTQLPGNYGPMYLMKLKVDDYKKYILTPLIFDEDDPNDLNLSYWAGPTNISRIGDYLYMIGWVQPEGGGETDRIHTLVQYDTSDDSYKIFSIDQSLGISGRGPVITDDQHLYIPFEYLDTTYKTRIVKYLASDFQSELWPKWNTSYGQSGVPITPVDTLEIPLTNVHAGLCDSTHLYVTMNNANFQANSIFQKISLSTFSVVDTAIICACTDDLCDTGTHIILGPEGNSNLDPCCAITVRKSDMNITSLGPHSVLGGINSYGTILGTIGGVEYLFNLITLGTYEGYIYIIRLDNIDTWSPLSDGDSEILRIIKIEFNDDGDPIVNNLHPRVANEIYIDSNEVCHVAMWGGKTELLCFKLAPL